MSLGLPNEDMELLNAAQDIIDKAFEYSLPDPCKPVTFCNYSCSGSCSGTCSGSADTGTGGI